MSRPLGVLLFVACLCSQSQAKMESERKIIADLFRDYSSVARPRKNPNETIEVKISYFLTAVLAVNEKSQTISTVGWLELKWADDFLSWDPSQYENISTLIVPSDKVWKPDLIFENSVADKFFNEEKFMTRLYHTGEIVWEPGGTMVAFCSSLNLRNYPYDTQTCVVIIATWANPEDKVLSYAGDVDITGYKQNGEWDLRAAEMFNSSFDDNGDGIRFSEIHLQISLERKPLYQILNIILPTILLSVLNVFVFCLPADSGEKVSLAVTILLAFSVWLLMMNDMMPSTSDYVPMMGLYITTFMITSTFSVVIAVIVIRLHHNPVTRPIPHWVQTVYRSRRRLLTCLRKRLRKSKTESDLTAGQEEKEVQLDWKAVSRGVDKAAFYLFFLFIIIFTAVVIGVLRSSYGGSAPTSETT